MTADWPTTLPAAPLAEGFNEMMPDVVLRTDMDTGPAKLRRRTTAEVSALQVAYLLSATETALLDDFYMNTLGGGTLSFNYTHPRTAEAVTCRFARPPSYATENGEIFQAQLVLEVLP